MTENKPIMVIKIEEQLENKAKEEIEGLNLQCCKSSSIVGLTNEFVALKFVSLCSVGLTSLKDFPALPNLLELDLSRNEISGGLNYLLTCPKLIYLSLSDNKIEDFDAIQPLKELKNLEDLDLSGNAILGNFSTIEDYREKVFCLIPCLEILHEYDKKAQYTRKERLLDQYRIDEGNYYEYYYGKDIIESREDNDDEENEDDNDDVEEEEELFGEENDDDNDDVVEEEELFGEENDDDNDDVEEEEYPSDDLNEKDSDDVENKKDN